MEIAGCEVRVIGWLIKQLPDEHLKEMCWPSNRVWPSVIVQQESTGTKHPAPFVLNSRKFVVTLNIHRLISGQDVDEENDPFILDHRPQHFPRRRSLLEFRLAGRSTVTPMHCLLLGLWGNVCNPRFIICDDPDQKLIVVIILPLKKCQC